MRELHGRARIGAGHSLWLARTLVDLDLGLKTGDIILTGALGPMVPLKPCDQVVAKVGGLGSASFNYQART